MTQERQVIRHTACDMAARILVQCSAPELLEAARQIEQYLTGEDVPEVDPEQFLAALRAA